MAEPGSELATYAWLTGQSGLGELLDVDYEAMPLIRLYRTSDLLVRHRQAIEARLFSRISDLFSLPATVTLYDLTNTYFEGAMAGNGKARRGHSKEKRSDCPLVTLGLVLDGSGFVRRSRMFEGNAIEAATLEQMLTGLAAPAGALVIMDRGIATEANIAWLTGQHYRYLVVSRERKRQFAAEQAIAVTTAAKNTVRIQRVLSEDGTELRLYCHSGQRENKETAITQRFSERFERGLAKLAAALPNPARRQTSRQNPAATRPAAGEEPRHRPALPDRTDAGCRRRQDRGLELGKAAGCRDDGDPPRGLLPAHQRVELG